MRKGFCEIICIVDRSGSMESIQNDAIGGFNIFIEKQKEIEGDASVTFVQFDHEYELVYENKNLKDVPKLNAKTYEPRGSTALLDAIGKTINNVGARLDKTDEKDRPEKVIVAIITDGEENSSKKYTRDKIFEMITHQKEKYSWEFLFLAANQDAIQSGVKFGIAPSDCFNYAFSGVGVQTMCASTLHGCVTNYRVSVNNNVLYEN